MTVLKECTDAELVERAHTNPRAFDVLVERYYQRALRVAYGLLQNQADAEDAVQDAFARAYPRLSSFQGHASFYTWFYRVLTNVCIDTLRKKRKNVHSLAALEAQSVYTGEFQQQALFQNYQDKTPQESVERQELSKALSKVFADLPEIHTTVITLREVEGLSYEEIAQVLDVKPGTVMSRLHHARQALVKQLEKRGLMPKSIEFSQQQGRTP